MEQVDNIPAAAAVDPEQSIHAAAREAIEAHCDVTSTTIDLEGKKIIIASLVREYGESKEQPDILPKILLTAVRNRNLGDDKTLKKLVDTFLANVQKFTPAIADMGDIGNTDQTVSIAAATTDQPPIDVAARAAITTHCAATIDQEAQEKLVTLFVYLYGKYKEKPVLLPDILLSSSSSTAEAYGWNLGGEEMLEKLVDAFLENVQKCTPAIVDSRTKGRIADLDYQVRRTSLGRHSYHDVDEFCRRVRTTLTTWEQCRNQTGSASSAKDGGYDGPYFCFIQSSGMGKTKIMYEAVRTSLMPQQHQQSPEQSRQYPINDNDGDVVMEEDDDAGDHTFISSAETTVAWKCALVIPTKYRAQAQDREVFAHDLDFPNITSDNNISELSLTQYVAKGFAVLDQLLRDVTNQTVDELSNLSSPVLLCFDESQAYLADVTIFDDALGRKEIKAFWFRVIRVWLRIKRNSHTVVAVFAGTTAKLGNFQSGDDKDILGRAADPDSRSWAGAIVDRYTKGTGYFPVFCTTTTIGCLVSTTTTADALESAAAEGVVVSDYHRAIMYGRPLFALLFKDKQLDSEALKMTAVLGRMLQNSSDNIQWKLSETALLSILATRVQMGQTTFRFASQLVGNGYANLLGVSWETKTAHITYLPDPVCARLAMGMMMGDGFQLGPFRGMGARFWAEQAARVFQLGLCIPEKGNAGEIFVTLYFLFCGDQLRREEGSSDNSTFAVNLLDWICLVRDGGQVTKQTPAAAPPPTRVGENSLRRSARVAANEQEYHPAGGGQDKISNGPCCVKINFIQVCRNHLRSFGYNWAGLANQQFLRYLYNSAIAFYTYPGCPLIDFVAPIKIHINGTEPVYIPMVVSIKARAYYSPAYACNDCEAMEAMAGQSKLQGALCLLVVLGSTAKSKDGARKADDAGLIVQSLVAKQIVAKVLRIPMNDVFSISKHFRTLTSDSMQVEELLASHPFIQAFHGDQVELSSERALRSDASKEAMKMLDGLK